MTIETVFAFIFGFIAGLIMYKIRTGGGKSESEKMPKRPTTPPPSKRAGSRPATPPPPLNDNE